VERWKKARVKARVGNMRIERACAGNVKNPYNLEARKRPVDLTLNEDLVQQAKGMTDDLSGAVESLLTEFVAQEQRHRLAKAKALEATIAVWNDFNTRVDSFADEYSFL
jgi:antitoxin CcdA